MDSIRLVTRADDAAMNSTANRAIRATAKQGIVRNISILGTGPAIEGAAEQLGDLSQHVDFGFHACLTAEWEQPRWGSVLPAADVPSLLTAEATFATTVDELSSLPLDPHQIRRELEAQLQRIVDAGFSVSYVDEHMLIGSIPAVRQCLSELATAHRLVYDRALHEAGALAPLPEWDGPGAHPGTELADHLSTIKPGTYLLVGHPAFKSQEMERVRRTGQPDGEVLYERNRQRRMLADIEIVDYCDNGGIELLRYSELQ